MHPLSFAFYGIYTCLPVCWFRNVLVGILQVTLMDEEDVCWFRNVLVGILQVTLMDEEDVEDVSGCSCMNRCTRINLRLNYFSVT